MAQLPVMPMLASGYAHAWALGGRIHAHTGIMGKLPVTSTRQNLKFPNVETAISLDPQPPFCVDTSHHYDNGTLSDAGTSLMLEKRKTRGRKAAIKY